MVGLVKTRTAVERHEFNPPTVQKTLVRYKGPGIDEIGARMSLKRNWPTPQTQAEYDDLAANLELLLNSARHGPPELRYEFFRRVLEEAAIQLGEAFACKVAKETTEG